jgi:isoleucyl-tRNA synthetase
MFIFYEGPPTANARPGIHHVLSRVFKDLIPRYKTMQGYRVPRKGGWDTHGLPVELEIEKELGLKSKPDIEQYGIAAFNAKCKESVTRYVEEWTRLSERIAFWADYDNPYVTYSNDYIETGWWIFKQMWDHGLVYQDYRVTPHCPRCGTSLSDHEVSQGYQDDTPDPSVFVKFRVPSSEFRERTGLDGDNVALVAWTTTPWTLPGNTALAVKADAEYGIYVVGDERLVLAKELATTVLGEDPELARL